MDQAYDLVRGHSFWPSMHSTVHGAPGDVTAGLSFHLANNFPDTLLRWPLLPTWSPSALGLQTPLPDSTPAHPADLIYEERKCILLLLSPEFMENT